MGQLINAGYRGLAIVNGTRFRFADASISAKQTINAPDMVMGDWNHDAYVYGKIEVGGSISGPVTETFVTGSGSIWEWATQRAAPCGTMLDKEVELFYYCGDGTNKRVFGGMFVNSINISCTAGDIANFSLDLMGKSASALSSDTPDVFSDPEKLITWDRVSVSITSNDDDSAAIADADINYSAFDFTISNNLEAAYTLKQTVGQDLFPAEIVPGIRTITGTLSVYNTPAAEGFDNWELYEAANISVLKFNLGGLEKEFNVRFHRIEPKSTTGLIVSTVGFTGVGPQDSLDI